MYDLNQDTFQIEKDKLQNMLKKEEEDNKVMKEGLEKLKEFKEQSEGRFLEF